VAAFRWLALALLARLLGWWRLGVKTQKRSGSGKSGTRTKQKA
jgi:hypothetical protein